MMTREDRQEALSLAYIKAVAACAGMTHSFPSKDYGIDIALTEIGRLGDQFRETGCRLDFQVKSTTNVIETRTTVAYDLSAKAYNDLRVESPARRFLVVVVLPRDEVDWLRQTRAKLEVRHCGYWLSLRGRLAMRNRSSVRVTIPKRQLFTPAALEEIIHDIRNGRA